MPNTNLVSHTVTTWAGLAGVQQKGFGWVEAHADIEDGCPGEYKQHFLFPARCRLMLCSPESVQLLVTQALSCLWAEVLLLCGDKVLHWSRGWVQPQCQLNPCGVRCQQERTLWSFGSCSGARSRELRSCCSCSLTPVCPQGWQSRSGGLCDPVTWRTGWVTTPQQPVLASALCHIRAPALLGLGVSIHPFCPQVAEQAVLIQGFVLVPEQTPSRP